MNESTKDLLKAVGFFKEVENVEKGVCAFCGSNKVKPEDFKDALSLKEFSISNLCQQCQDSTLTEDEYIE